MVVVGGVPSPWGEAAKGLLHIKGIAWVAVRLAYDSEALKAWAGERSGPVAIYDEEAPRSGWAEILALTERLAPAPSLLPAAPGERVLALDLARDLCGEDGLGWWRRLQLVEAGLQNAGGFSERVSKYLGKKYGYSPAVGASSGPRVADLAGHAGGASEVAARGREPLLRGRSVDRRGRLQRDLRRDVPAPAPEQCAMDAGTRAAFETLDEETEAALDPILFEHRDMMYAEHLELPLSL